MKTVSKSSNAFFSKRCFKNAWSTLLENYWTDWIKILQAHFRHQNLVFLIFKVWRHGVKVKRKKTRLENFKQSHRFCFSLFLPDSRYPTPPADRSRYRGACSPFERSTPGSVWTVAPASAATEFDDHGDGLGPWRASNRFSSDSSSSPRHRPTTGSSPSSLPPRTNHYGVTCWNQPAFFVQSRHHGWRQQNELLMARYSASSNTFERKGEMWLGRWLQKRTDSKRTRWYHDFIFILRSIQKSCNTT